MHCTKKVDACARDLRLKLVPIQRGGCDIAEALVWGLSSVDWEDPLAENHSKTELKGFTRKA